MSRTGYIRQCPASAKVQEFIGKTVVRHVSHANNGVAIEDSFHETVNAAILLKVDFGLHADCFELHKSKPEQATNLEIALPKGRYFLREPQTPSRGTTQKI